MMRVLVACGNGSGTSLMIRKTVEKAYKAKDVKITNIHHCAISEGKSTAKNFDVVFTPANFVKMFDQAAKKGVKIIGVKNPMSQKEIEERMVENDIV